MKSDKQATLTDTQVVLETFKKTFNNNQTSIRKRIDNLYTRINELDKDLSEIEGNVHSFIKFKTKKESKFLEDISSMRKKYFGLLSELRTYDEEWRLHSRCISNSKSYDRTMAEFVFNLDELSKYIGELRDELEYVSAVFYGNIIPLGTLQQTSSSAERILDIRKDTMSGFYDKAFKLLQVNGIAIGIVLTILVNFGATDGSFQYIIGPIGSLIFFMASTIMAVEASKSRVVTYGPSGDNLKQAHRIAFNECEYLYWMNHYGLSKWVDSINESIEGRNMQVNWSIYLFAGGILLLLTVTGMEYLFYIL